MITASHDKTIRLWDLRMGKTLSTLTYHKKVGVAVAVGLGGGGGVHGMTGGAGAPACPRDWLCRTRAARWKLGLETLRTALLHVGSAWAPCVAGGEGAGFASVRVHLCFGGRRQHQEVQASPGRLFAQHAAASKGESWFQAPAVAQHGGRAPGAIPPDPGFKPLFVQAIINALAINEDGVMVSGGDNGSLWFWDYKSGNVFQEQSTIAQPGSLESEQGEARDGGGACTSSAACTEAGRACVNRRICRRGGAVQERS